MIQVTFGSPISVRVLRTIAEEEPGVGPGVYIYSAVFDGRPDLAHYPTAREKLNRVIQELYAKVRQEAPYLTWTLHHAQLTYDPETRQGQVQITYELQPSPRASLGAIVWLIVKIIAGIILAYLAYRIIHTTVYVGERISEGVMGAADVLKETLPILLPIAAVVLLVALLR